MANKALLVGINYVGTDSELRGCANDIGTVQSLLMQNGFTKKDITLVSDAHPEAKIKPTRQNIIDSLKALIKGARAGDTLVFHYSGHGTQERDRLFGGDERDGYDEVICSLDGRNVTLIKDDELKQIIAGLPKDVKLFVLMDCCHSGSILDLANNTNSTEKLSSVKITNGFVSMISGCNDNQLSADAYLAQKYQGAMTAAFKAMVVERYKSFQSVLDICFSNSIKRMTDLRNNIWSWLESNDFDQRPNLAYEGTLPQIMPSLRAYQAGGGYSLRALAARNEGSYHDVPADYTEGKENAIRLR